jgi:nucleoside-diphosphate-sugar epimerase
VRVLVAGAGGVIGRPLVRRLAAAGHDVTALTRSAAKQGMLADAGASPVICDAMDAPALAGAVAAARPDVVVNQLTALPARINPRRIGRDLAQTSRLRREGTRNLMTAAAAAGVAHAVAQSVAFAYAPGGDGLRSEGDRLYLDAHGAFGEMVAAIAELEHQTLGTPGIRGAVLRYGFFYGPGTSYAADGSIAADVRRGRFPVAGDGSGTFSFIHGEDAARATVAVIEQGAVGVWNIVDDEPAALADWLPAYAAMLAAPPPRRVPAWLARMAVGPYGAYLMTQMPGAANGHARETLGWRPERPTWRQQLAEAA